MGSLFSFAKSKRDPKQPSTGSWSLSPDFEILDCLISRLTSVPKQTPKAILVSSYWITLQNSNFFRMMRLIKPLLDKKRSRAERDQGSTQPDHHSCCHGHREETAVRCRLDRRHAAYRRLGTRVDVSGKQRRPGDHAELRQRSPLGNPAQHSFLPCRGLLLEAKPVPPRCSWGKFDGFVKSPSAAFRFIFRHCGVLLCTPHSSTCLLKAGIRAPCIWSFLREKARMPRSEERG